jgi:hypothetical protein
MKGPCNHGSVRVINRGKDGSLFECIFCGMVTEHPGVTEWRERAPSDKPSGMSESRWVKTKE